MTLTYRSNRNYKYERSFHGCRRTSARSKIRYIGSSNDVKVQKLYRIQRVIADLH